MQKDNKRFSAFDSPLKAEFQLNIGAMRDNENLAKEFWT